MATYGASIYGLSKYGTAARSDGGLTLVNLGVTPFTAEPLSYDTVRLNWQPPGGAWTTLKIVRNRAGYAINEFDGDTVLTINSSTAGSMSTTLDTGLQGGWQYYTIFVWEPSRAYAQRAAVASAMVPFDYDSTEKIWSLIPDYYRVIRGDQTAGYSKTLYNINPRIYLSTDNTVDNNHLLNFTSVLGWGVDLLRSQIDSVLDGYNTQRVHWSRLALLADQFGSALEYAAPAQNNRSLVRNLALLARRRGTIGGIREALALTSGWDVDVYLGPNLMLNRDQSSFASPIIEDWSQEKRYVTGEYVLYNKNYFQALQTAYGPTQAPNLTKTDNAWWNGTMFAEPPVTTLRKRVETGGVGSWQALASNGSVITDAGIGLGVSDPLDGLAAVTNSFTFVNTSAVADDITVRSVPRYLTDGAVYDRALTAKSTIPVPYFLTPYDPARSYEIGDRVSYLGLPYRAKVPTTKVPTTTSDWDRVGVDSRPRLALSFYAHGSFTSAVGTGGVPVRPYVAWFDEQANFISEAALVPEGTTGPIYDPFHVPGTITSGRAVEVGSKTWSAGVGAWNPGYIEGIGGYAYPTAAGRTYQVLDSGMADCNVAVTFRNIGVTNREIGLIFRYSDASNFWIATQNGLYKVVAGAARALVGATWTAFQPGQRMTVSLTGSTIVVKRDGVTVQTSTDAFNSTATRHGILAEA